VDCLTKVAHFIPIQSDYSGANLAEQFIKIQFKYQQLKKNI
jgi:hypothetical protein